MAKVSKISQDVVVVLLASLLTFTSETQAGGCGCPSYWTPFGKQCYRFFTKDMTWFEAELHCREFSIPCTEDDSQQTTLGHLASVHSQEEMDFLSGLYDSARTKRGSSWVWIGLHDRANETSLKWTDGSPLDYTNWTPGEPQPGENQDCVIFRRESEFQWYDAGCTWSAVESFLCKMPKW